MVHIKYNKIHRLGKEEVEGILDHEVLIQEKIDGANTSIWMEDGELKFGSRNNEVPDFRGIKTYAEKHDGIKKFLENNSHCRLFGEWLVKHTLPYKETAYRHFYLYDILNEETDEWLDPLDVKFIAETHDIKTPQVFARGKFTEAEINEYVGQTELGDRGEGVVVKSTDFVGPFDTYPAYAKIVTQEFKENNAITFGGNAKHSETYWEQYVCNEFMTLARVKKIIQKIESVEDKRIDISYTPRVAHTAYHDMLEEEIWTIQKKVKGVSFKALSRICMKKAEQIFKDILNESLGVADEK